jgi:hypothetical protein
VWCEFYGELVHSFLPTIMPDQSDQCAIGPDSHLKDAYEIVWHNNLDDEHPILAPGPSATAEKSSILVHHFFTGA